MRGVTGAALTGHGLAGVNGWVVTGQEGKMLRLSLIAALALCICLPGVRAEARDVHVACVQGQLAALGHDPGPVDGLSGPQTRAALSEYVSTVTAEEGSAHFDLLPEFSSRAAVGWCREIGLRAPEAAALMPSANAPEMFIGPNVHPEMASHLAKAFSEAEGFLYRRYGIEVASQVKIVAATNVEAWHAEVDKAGTMKLQGWAEVRARARRDCETEFGLGASASRDGLAFCGSVLALREPKLRDLYQMVLSVTMTHELVHNVQREFSYDKVARWVRNPDGVRPRMGPAWMVEGTAQVVEQAFMEERFDRLEPALHVMRAQAAASDLTLRNIRLSGQVREAEAYDVSAYAVAMLLERYGEETLFRYWRAVGETDNWYTAFEDTYGMTVQEFEDLYTTLRDDGMAQREFLADRDMNGDRALAHRPLTEAELLRLPRNPPTE